MLTDVLLMRDELQMRAIDALLNSVSRSRPRSKKDVVLKVRTSRKWAGFQSVLCPIDFSEHSRLALKYAYAVARHARARLTIAYVNDPLLIAAAGALGDRRLATRSKKELDAFVDATLSKKVRARILLKTQVSIGGPSAEILRCAGRYRSDLIVLGTHGLTGASRILLGSTTLGVLQQTAVPVLAVPLPPESRGAEVASGWPGSRIVAPLELDSESSAEADTAARIAEWFGSSLALLHVIDTLRAPAWLAAARIDRDAARVARAERHLTELASKTRRHVTTDTHVVRGRVADEIAAFAEAEQTHLIVTALRDRHTWFGAGRGSVSYHVLSHAVSPVLAYPSRWRPL